MANIVEKKRKIVVTSASLNAGGNYYEHGQVIEVTEKEYVKLMHTGAVSVVK